MLLELLTILLLALIPASFNYFLDYCFGHPMSREPQTKAIFSSWSYFLARRRLKKEDKFEALENAFEGLEPREAKRQLKLTVMLEAQKWFTFEQAFGMCPFCTNFWIASFSALIMFFTIQLQHISPFLLFLLIPTFSHLILRKL